MKYESSTKKLMSLIIALQFCPEAAVAEDSVATTATAAKVRTISEAMLGLNGIAHLNGAFQFDSNLWLKNNVEAKDPSSSDVLRMTSIDGKMALETGFNGDEISQVISWIKEPPAGRPSASLTNIAEGVATSHTFVLQGEAFTVTENVCKIIANQFRAKSMEDFAKSAKTCDSFYRVEPVDKSVLASVQKMQAVHEENLKRLGTSVAKDATTQDVPAKSSAGMGSGVDYVRDLVASMVARSDKPKAVPKTAKDIFDPKTYPDGFSYRATLAEVGSACGRFYPTIRAAAPAPRSAAPKNSTNPVAK